MSLWSSVLSTCSWNKLLAIKQCSQDLKGLVWKCLFCHLGPKKKNQQHTQLQPTDSVDLHTTPPPHPPTPDLNTGHSNGRQVLSQPCPLKQRII